MSIFSVTNPLQRRVIAQRLEAIRNLNVDTNNSETVPIPLLDSEIVKDLKKNDNDRGPPIAKIVRNRNGVRQEWPLYQGI